MWWIPFKKIPKTVTKLVKNQIFKKSLPSLETNLTLLFFFFFTRMTQNQSRTTNYLAVEQRQDQHKVRHVWSIGIISYVLREIQMWTQVTWKYFTKNVQIRLIFQTLSLISPKFDVVCLQLYSWLENYGRYGSFGTMILGSLIVSPVLWLLSSRNTLSVTHSDKVS